MGYAIPRVVKLKTTKAMSDSYNHNFRIFHVENADPLKQHLNEELIDELNGRSYQDMFEDEMRYYQMIGSRQQTIRSDAVRGFEVMLSFSREDADKIEVDAWAKANVEWLQKTFNPPGGEIHYTDPATGQEVTRRINNVKSVVLHMDESRPHIHAYIIPIDENGRLNASAYTGDRQKMVEIQNSYAKAMEPFGLQRGERHSVARHEQVSKYYNKLLDAVEAQLPEPQPGESVQEYYSRANGVYQTECVHHRDEIVKKDQDIIRAKSSVYDDRIELMKERQAFTEEKAAFDSQADRLSRAVGQELTPESMREIRHVVEEAGQFKKAIEDHPDRDKAERAQSAYQEMIVWQQSRERKGRERNDPSLGPESH